MAEQTPPTFSQDHLQSVANSYHEEVTRLLELKANLKLQILNLQKSNSDLQKKVSELTKENQELKAPKENS